MKSSMIIEVMHPTGIVTEDEDGLEMLAWSLLAINQMDMFLIMMIVMTTTHKTQIQLEIAMTWMTIAE